MDEARDWYESQMEMLGEQLESAREIKDETVNRSTQARLVEMIATAAERRALEESEDEMRLYGPLFFMLESGHLVDAVRRGVPDDITISVVRSLLRINLATARTCPGFDIDKRADGLLEEMSSIPAIAELLLEVAASIDAPDKDIVYSRVATLLGSDAAGGFLSMQRIDLVYAALGPLLTTELLRHLSGADLAEAGALGNLLQELDNRIRRRPQFLPLLAAAAMAVEVRHHATFQGELVDREKDLPNLASQYGEALKHFGSAVVESASAFGFTSEDLGASLDQWTSNWHYNSDLF